MRAVLGEGEVEELTGGGIGVFVGVWRLEEDGIGRGAAGAAAGSPSGVRPHDHRLPAGVLPNPLFTFLAKEELGTRRCPETGFEGIEEGFYQADVEDPGCDHRPVTTASAPSRNHNGCYTR